MYICMKRRVPAHKGGDERPGMGLGGAAIWTAGEASAATAGGRKMTASEPASPPHPHILCKLQAGLGLARSR